jgi:hypothetical protein
VVRALEQRFQGFTLKHIPRAENTEADELAKAAANNLLLPANTFYQVLQVPATKGMTKAFQEVLLTELEDWRQPIIDSLNDVHHSNDEASAARMAARARSYAIVRGQLYKKGVVQPLLKCISQDKGKELLLKNSFRQLWLAHWPKSVISKSHKVGVLLAYTCQGH